MRVAMALLLAGCGRVGFDAIASDAATDTTSPISDAIDARPADTCPFHPAALFCDGFEGNLDAWTVLGGSPQVVTNRVHGGVGALESPILAAPEYVLLEHLLPSITALAELHLRAWVFAPAGQTLDHVNLINFVASNGQGLSLYVMGGSLEVYRDTGQTGSSNGVPFTLDIWHCVELAVSVADTGGAVQLTLDDQLVVDQTNVDTHPAGGFDRLHAGIPFSGPTQSGPATIYTDDVVVDVTPIGCAP